MTKIVWTNTKPRYESGVDRGVLYPLGGPGVAWQGLISVEDSHVGGEVEAIYVDGVKYLDLPSSTNYQATLTAFSSPEEFAPCNGEIQAVNGLILTRQPRQRFGLSYRSIIGDGLGHKIHLVYNALATPTGRGHSSLNNTPSPNNLTWQIDATPLESTTHRPSAHFIVDTSEVDPEPLSVVEAILYGTETRDPYLPTPRQIATIIDEWFPMVINEDPVTGISPIVSGTPGDLIESDIDGLYISLPSGRLTETRVRGLYQLTE